MNSFWREPLPSPRRGSSAAAFTNPHQENHWRQGRDGDLLQLFSKGEAGSQAALITAQLRVHVCMHTWSWENSLVEKLKKVAEWKRKFSPSFFIHSITVVCNSQKEEQKPSPVLGHLMVCAFFLSE